jgi:hypothetical protein
MKSVLITLFLCSILISCDKEYTRQNMYDKGALVDRNYTLEFDHIEVTNEASTANVNGLLDVDEIATLQVYLKNNGPDPCMLSSGTFETMNFENGFYIKNFDININEGGLHFLESSAAAGYDVHYIEPGKTDCISCDVRIYPYCQANQDVPCLFQLWDFDGDMQEVQFDVHIE